VTETAASARRSRPEPGAWALVLAGIRVFPRELTGTEPRPGTLQRRTKYRGDLERWGIVEAGRPRADGRDRPWTAKGRSIEVSSQVPRGTVLAESAVLETFLDRNRTLVAEFLDHQASEPPEWRDAAELASNDYWLTAEELAEASHALRSVLQPYADRRRGSRPDKSQRVRVRRLTVPRSRPSPLADSRPDGAPREDPVG
jgi:hypothetical protein